MTHRRLNHAMVMNGDEINFNGHGTLEEGGKMDLTSPPVQPLPLSYSSSFADVGLPSGDDSVGGGVRGDEETIYTTTSPTTKSLEPSSYRRLVSNGTDGDANGDANGDVNGDANGAADGHVNGVFRGEKTLQPATTLSTASSVADPVQAPVDIDGSQQRRTFHRIDVHHHFIPQCYVAAYQQAGGKDPSGWKLPTWNLDATKTLMTEQSISTTILSLTAPGCTIIHGTAAVQLARSVNESAASIRDADPTRFGFFAALPPVLDDMDAAVREAIYALDVLQADGVTLYTRYGAGNTYLGDAALLPLWSALNARQAVVFIHPTHLPITDLVNPRLPQPMIDYPHETTRAAVDLIMHNRIREFPQCRIILSHAGGTLPYLATRAAHMLPDYGLSAKPAAEFLADARTLYYDLALSGNEFTLTCLIRFVGPAKILFGTDFPYAPLKTVRTHTAGVDAFEMDEEMNEKIARGNALELFPRLRDLPPSPVSWV